MVFDKVRNLTRDIHAITRQGTMSIEIRMLWELAIMLADLCAIQVKTRVALSMLSAIQTFCATL